MLIATAVVHLIDGPGSLDDRFVNVAAEFAVILLAGRVLERAR